MTQDERLEYLLNSLLQENNEFRHMSIRTEDRRKVLRSLMNIRLPGAVSQEFLQIQDEFLQQEALEKGIVTISEIPSIAEQYGSTRRFADRISIWQGDITRLAADAIVNAANAQMLGCFVPCHGCIDNAIHSAAGIRLREECAEVMRRQGHEERTGCAKITGSYNLPCRYVLHTVGPIVNGALQAQHCRQLASCYRSCLLLAEEMKLESVAFCCISTGEFHFPNEKAADIAVETVDEFLEKSTIKRVIFNVFKDYDLRIYEEKLIGQ